MEEEWELDFNDLKLGKILGSGAFGYVKKATYENQDVAVKFFHSDDPKDIEKSLKEIILMW